MAQAQGATPTKGRMRADQIRASSQWPHDCPPEQCDEVSDPWCPVASAYLLSRTKPDGRWTLVYNRPDANVERLLVVTGLDAQVLREAIADSVINGRTDR